MGRSPRLTLPAAGVAVTSGLSVVVGSIFGGENARYRGMRGAPSDL